MLITLPRDIVSKHIELYLKTHTDRTGVVKALDNLIRVNPNVKFIKFVYTQNEGTIIVGSATIDVFGEHHVNDLIRWIFYDESEEGR
ncbi:MAG: hypothetical protein DRG31_02200 [Deltaproteobacteria bacterium]|nr:MAG: hypothetical protein DRG31_02200 [Deltaproteobacteria bacterium]